MLTGCRKGAVPRALLDDGPAAARRALDRLVAAFGRDRVFVELWDHGDPLDRHRNDALAELAARAGVDVVATNNVHYATPGRRPLATALAAVRARRSLDELDGWLPAGAVRAPAQHRRSRPAASPAGPARWSARSRSRRRARSTCASPRPSLPDHEVPAGHTDMTWLRELTQRGAALRYPPTHPQHEQALRQIAYELDVIEQLGFPGYFLVLVDIVEFCRVTTSTARAAGARRTARSATRSASPRPTRSQLGLLFERFLSPERDGPPDIDLDIEHQRREEVIQYVYDKYGRDRAAQVANVITYRPQSALREMAKACGLSPGHADALTKWVDRWGRDAAAFEGVTSEGPPVPELVLDLATQVLDFPRHLGIHSGGMVMADRPLVEFCPVEWARMEGRSVLQWDKDDCAAAGLVKFDLLGLGMLTMLHLAVDLVREHEGIEIDLATIPQEDAVYDLLCAADTIGVFQVESRAQMATLPRLRPRNFYDLVVEVALIRPGPIQGGSVHPYLRRRNGEEPVTYPHPILEECLEKTLGRAAVPGAADADGDRRRRLHARGGRPAPPGDGLEAVAGPHGRDARAAHRGHGRAWHRRRDRRGDRRQARGVRRLRLPREPLGELRLPRVLELVDQAALPGRVRVRAAERAADGLLLAAHDRARRGPPRRGGARARREPVAAGLHARAAYRGGRSRSGTPRPGWHADPSTHAVRIGLRYVRGLADALLDRIDEERAQAPFRRPRGLHPPHRRARRRAGGARHRRARSACFGVNRRAALWAAGALRDARVRQAARRGRPASRRRRCRA